MAKRISALIIIALLAYGLIINCSSKTNPTGPSSPGGELPTPNLSLTPPLIPTFTETDTVDPLSTYTFTNTHTDTVQDTFTETYTQTYTESETPTDTQTVEPTSTHTAVPSPDGFENDNTSGAAVELSVDTMRYASICPIGDVDWIWFTLAETRGVSITVKTGNADAYLNAYLYESDASTYIFGTVTTSTVENTFIRYEVLGAGTYYINLPNFEGIPAELNYTIQLVTEPGVLPTSTDTYTLEPTFTSSETPTPIDSWEPQDNDWTTAPQLTPDVMQLHAADYPDNSIDWALLMLPEPAYISIITGGAPMTNGNSMLLYTSAGVVLNDPYRNNSGNLAGKYSGIDVILDAGTYYVRVNTFEDNPNYHILYTVLTSTYTNTIEPTYTQTDTPTPGLTPDLYEGDDGCGSSKPIENGQTQTRWIDDTDIDFIHFTVSAHSQVIITTAGTDGGDTVMQLLSDPCSGLITEDDDGNGGGYSKITASLTPGLYGIRITGKNVMGGFYYNYTLNLQMTEYTPTVTLTYTSTPTCTPSVTSTNTITSTVTITMTAEDTKTATVSPTVTITATSTNTALPGTVWTRAVEHAEFSERRDFGSIEFNGGDGNKMWVIGGTGSEYFNDAYNSTDGITWQQVTQTTPFTARAKHITLFYQSKLWLICGEDGLNKSDIWYSSNGADWTRASTMTALARWTDSAGAVFNPGGEDKMYVAGGFKDGLYQSSVYSSTDGVNWIMLAGSAGFAPRAGHTLTAFNGELWLIGGSYNNDYFNDVWHSADGITWTQATAAAEFPGRHEHVTLVSGGRLWVIGGADDSVRFEDAWYSTDGINWTKASSQTDLGRESAGGVVFGGKMWLIGGTTAHNYNYGNEVLWSY